MWMPKTSHILALDQLVLAQPQNLSFKQMAPTTFIDDKYVLARFEPYKNLKWL